MKKLNLPARFTGTLYAYVYSDPTSCLYGHMDFSKSDPSGREDLILVGQVEVDVPLDASGSLDKQISQLRKSKQMIIAEATARAEQIEEAIQSLLAIENKESV